MLCGATTIISIPGVCRPEKGIVEHKNRGTEAQRNRGTVVSEESVGTEKQRKCCIKGKNWEEGHRIERRRSDPLWGFGGIPPENFEI